MNFVTPITLARVDIAFANMLQTHQASHPDAWLLAALTSYAYRAGHACLVTHDSLTEIDIVNYDGLWIGRLSRDWQQQEYQCPWWQIDSQENPMVWQANRLYLRRAWQDEQWIQAAIQQRLSMIDHHPTPLTPWLECLFGSIPANSTEVDWQRVACALASRTQFSIITGGPGTGKTTTVVRLLALLQRLAQQKDNKSTSLKIGLSAPTGKAAARLASSIQQAMMHLPTDFQLGLPTQAQTLHKWLASDALVQCECFIVDEASMIDLHLMAQLLRKLPLSCRLILLGDKDQLASVDAGAVLGQLCDGAEEGNYSLETHRWLADFAGQYLPSQLNYANHVLSQQIVMLRYSHRFDAQSAIGQWARWVNSQDTSSIKHEFKHLPNWTVECAESVARLSLNNEEDHTLKHLILDQWKSLVTLVNQSVEVSDPDDWAKKILIQLNEFQVLCAVREGHWGLVAMNQLMAQWLGIAAHQWQVGRVVMMTRNDYTLNLMNGELGICLQHPQKGLRVAFAGETSIRWILPLRLSHFEDAYAMSVHKSQGSEFNRVVLLLPERESPIVTKELIYTAVTRAKKQFILGCANPQQLFNAVARSIQRAGGLTFE